MFWIEQFAPAGLAALLIALCICGFGAWARGRATREVFGAAAIAAGYAAGHWRVMGWKGFPPTDVVAWPGYFAVAALMVGMAILAIRRRAVAGALTGMLAIGAMVLLLLPRIRTGWGLGGAAVAIGAGGAVLAVWWGGNMGLQRMGSLVRVFQWALVAAGMALALALSGSLLLGQLAGVLLTVLTGVIVAHGWRVAIGAAAGLILALVIGALAACGWLYADLPIASAGLLLAAAAMPPVGRGLGWRTLLAHSLAVILTAALAVFIAFRSSPPLDPYY